MEQITFIIIFNLFLIFLIYSLNIGFIEPRARWSTRVRRVYPVYTDTNAVHAFFVDRG